MGQESDTLRLSNMDDDVIIGPRLRDRKIPGVSQLKLPGFDGGVIQFPANDDFSAHVGKLLYLKKLTASDAETKRKTTHPKGCLTFGQAGFYNPDEDKLIDQTKYFRNEAFAGASWHNADNRPKPTQQARLYFAVRINQHFYGIFRLVVQHKPSGEANQGNSPTVLQWGPLKPIIRAVVSPGQRVTIHAPTAKRRWLYFLEIS